MGGNRCIKKVNGKSFPHTLTNISVNFSMFTSTVQNKKLKTHTHDNGHEFPTRISISNTKVKAMKIGLTVNSYGAITFFREHAPPIRAQIHKKKKNKNATTMTIKDI